MIVGADGSGSVPVPAVRIVWSKQRAEKEVLETIPQMQIDVFNGVEDTVKIKTGYKIRQKSRNHYQGTEGTSSVSLALSSLLRLDLYRARPQYSEITTPRCPLEPSR